MQKNIIRNLLFLPFTLPIENVYPQKINPDFLTLPFFFFTFLSFIERSLPKAFILIYSFTFLLSSIFSLIALQR